MSFADEILQGLGFQTDEQLQWPVLELPGNWKIAIINEDEEPPTRVVGEPVQVLVRCGKTGVSPRFRSLHEAVAWVKHHFKDVGQNKKSAFFNT